jgi:hypothetical protein
MDDRERGAEKENPLRAEILADDTGRDHEKQLARYAVAKARQAAVVDYIVTQDEQGNNLGLEKERKALSDCGEFLIYRHYYEIDQYKLKGGCTCKKHLLCALCAIRRAAKCIAVYSKKIEEVLFQGRENGIEYDQLFISFTIKNGFDLVERMDHLKDSFGKIIQKRRDALKKNPKTDTEFKHIQGTIYSYETSFNPETGYHPHIHMVALVPKGTFSYTVTTIKKKTVNVPMALWRDLVDNWKEITGDSYIIDVRLIEDKEGQLSALVETFKYALKLSDMDIAVQIESYKALKCRRLLGSMGALFGVKLPADLNDELLPGEEKYIVIVYRYSGSLFGYQEFGRGIYDCGRIASEDSTLARITENKEIRKVRLNLVDRKTETQLRKEENKAKVAQLLSEPYEITEEKAAEIERSIDAEKMHSEDFRLRNEWLTKMNIRPDAESKLVDGVPF